MSNSEAQNLCLLVSQQKKCQNNVSTGVIYVMPLSFYELAISRSVPITMIQTGHLLLIFLSVVPGQR